jgi:NAD-dependent dihydropyrimidine dehydrogenase PreA subunit
LESYQIAVVEKKCNGCGDCTIACPVNTSGKIMSSNAEEVVLRVKNGKLEVINPDLCDGCGMCIEACSRHALNINFPCESSGMKKSQ